MGADHQRFALVDMRQMTAEPFERFVRKPILISSRRAAGKRRIILHVDVVEEDVVQLPQVNGIVCRPKVFFIFRYGQVVARGILDVVVVADHMKHRKRKILDTVAIVFPQTHVVVHHIAQADTVHRTVGDRRGEFLHVGTHVFVNVDRMEQILVRSGIPGADLRIGRHQNRIPVV